MKIVELTDFSIRNKINLNRFYENGAIGVLHHRVQINIEILGILGMFLEAVGNVCGVNRVTRLAGQSQVNLKLQC